jgi:hypothetical protein
MLFQGVSKFESNPRFDPYFTQTLSRWRISWSFVIQDVHEEQFSDATRLLGNFCPFQKRPVESKFKRRKRVERDFASEKQPKKVHQKDKRTKSAIKHGGKNLSIC